MITIKVYCVSHDVIGFVSLKDQVFLKDLIRSKANLLVVEFWFYLNNGFQYYPVNNCSIPLLKVSLSHFTSIPMLN